MILGLRNARLAALAVPIGAVVVLGWVVAPAAAQEPGDGAGSVVLVLDASGSMGEDAGGGQTRMQAAKQGLRDVIDNVPADSSVGLRVYGASIESGLRSCKDSELLVPVRPVDKPALLKGVENIEPLGNTPMGYALKEAADDLPNDGPRSIILVSDGEENCGADPIEVARQISDSGVDLHVDVVGFQVDATARNQLISIASAGGGTYVDVPDAATLPKTLTRLSVRAARGYKPAGTAVEGGPEAVSAVEINDGQWLDTIGDSGTEFYRLLDPEEGTLYLAATLRPLGLGTADGAEISIAMTSVEGVECGTGARAKGIGVSTGTTPITATYTLSLEDREECGPGPYTMAVSAPDIKDVQPLEVLVSSEPAVTTIDGLPAAATDDDFDVQGDAPAAETFPVIGSPSFSGAPTLKPGTYTDTILGGEALFYRVDVDWGQQLVCDATIGANPDASFPNVVNMAVQTYGFQRGNIAQVGGDNKDSAFYAGDKSLELHAAALPVRYLNRTAASENQLASARAGGYYCAVFANAHPAQIDGFGETPVTLTVSVVGTAGEGKPPYLEDPESAKQAVEVTDDGGNSTGIIAGFAALVIAAAGGTWYYLRRHRSNSDLTAH